jgi:hypothetical protein
MRCLDLIETYEATWFYGGQIENGPLRKALANTYRVAICERSQIGLKERYRIGL